MNRKIISFSFLFLLLISIVSAEYLHVGDLNRDFLGGKAGLDADANVSTAIATLAQYASMFVMVGDFDNDTEDEIAFIHDNGVDLYSKSLVFDSSYTSICSSECTTSRIVAVDSLDIHDDGSPEIVATWLDIDDPAAGFNIIIETIGSHKGSFTNISSKQLSLTLVQPTDVLLGCDDIDKDCALIVFKNEGTPGCENAKISVISIFWNNSNEFNMQRQDNEIGGDAGAGSGLTLELNAADTECYYAPTLRSVSVKDYDNDGKNEFIFTYLKLFTTENADAVVRVISLANDVNHTPIDENEGKYDTLINAQNPMPDGDFKSGERNWSHIISPPIVGQYDSGNSPGLETYLGVANDEGSVDNWKFVLVYFNSEVNHDDEYPEQGGGNTDEDIEGYLISNPAAGSFFSDARADNSIFMNIYSNDNNNMRTLVTSQDIDTFGESGEHLVFTFNTTQYWNSEPGDLSLAIDFRHQIFAINSNRSTLKDEISTTYGMMSLDTTSVSAPITIFGLIPITLNFNFENYISNLQFKAYASDSILWIDDIDGSGFDDIIYYNSPSIIVQSGDAVKYGCGQNPPGNVQNNCFVNLAIDPCTTEPILQNSTVHVFGTVEDFEGDPLQVRVIIYMNDSNEQASQWQNYSSGASFIIVDSDQGNSLIFNKTGSFAMTMCVRDTDKPTSVYCELRYPTVSAGTGNVRGDGCQESINVPQVDESTEFEDTSGFTENNAVSRAILSFATGANVSVVILINLFAVVIAFSIFFGGMDQGLSMGKSASFGLGAGLLIMFIAAAFGLISIAWIIVPIILGLFGFIVLPYLTANTRGGD